MKLKKKYLCSKRTISQFCSRCFSQDKYLKKHLRNTPLANIPRSYLISPVATFRSGLFVTVEPQIKYLFIRGEISIQNCPKNNISLSIYTIGIPLWRENARDSLLHLLPQKNGHESTRAPVHVRTDHKSCDTRKCCSLHFSCATVFPERSE